MSEANELLRRALEAWDYGKKLSDLDEVMPEIYAYLANQETAKDEPVAWLCCDGGTGYLAFAQGSVSAIASSKGEQTNLPLYLNPSAPRKPRPNRSRCRSWPSPPTRSRASASSASTPA